MLFVLKENADNLFFSNNRSQLKQAKRDIAALEEQLKVLSLILLIYFQLSFPFLHRERERTLKMTTSLIFTKR